MREQMGPWRLRRADGVTLRRRRPAVKDAIARNRDHVSSHNDGVAIPAEGNVSSHMIIAVLIDQLDPSRSLLRPSV